MAEFPLVSELITPRNPATRLQDSITEARRELSRATSPTQREALTEELKSLEASLGAVRNTLAAPRPARVATPSGLFDLNAALGTPESPAAGSEPTSGLFDLESAFGPDTMPVVTPQPALTRRIEQPTGFATTPGGAATGVQFPGDRPRVSVSPETARLTLETIMTAIPGGVGLKLGGKAIGLVAETVGSMVGSRMAESFDPTADPTSTALQTGAFTAVGNVVGQGILTGVRRLVGRPAREGKELLDFLDSQGVIPPPGAVLNDSAFIRALHSIGRADAVMGSKIEQQVSQAAGTIDLELRRSLADYIRFKKTADTAFESWDNLRKTTLGESRVVKMDARALKALEAAAEEYKRVGAEVKLDNSLLSTIQAMRGILDSGAPVNSFKLTMREAEAARTLLYQQSKLLHAREVGGAAQKSIGGTTPSSGVRSLAEDVGKSMDEAIDAAIIDARMPTSARKTLENARGLWKQWKQGMEIVEELAPTIKTEGLKHETISSTQIFAAIKRMEDSNQRAGFPVVDTLKLANLAKLGRMMLQLEKANATSAFQYSVRAGQAIAITGAFTGTIPAQTLAIALTPPAVAWVVTNERAMRFLLEGMKAQPGSARALRLLRQFAVLGAKEGVMAPLDRVAPEYEETPAGGITGLTRPQ